MATRRSLANALRFLSIDAVQKAKSGHPGMPMGMADIAEVLWNDFLQHNPHNPHWFNRDRFILSNGHGSMLLYSLLHLTGYDLSLQDLKNFRQIHSKTPGHPEVGVTAGVEASTGPLGQGFAGAVGMALAEKLLSERYNRSDCKIVDHHTYCFMGDGCLMEGISHEAASIAGLLGLNKLIVFWDDNGISIDGSVANWFADNTPQRFEAYGWQVIVDIDGQDAVAVRDAIEQAHNSVNKPVLICCKTAIGYGAPNLCGSEKAHGAPLGDEEITVTRKNLNWEYSEFEIPQDIYSSWNAEQRGEQLESAWKKLWDKYQSNYPDLACELQRRIDKMLPTDWEKVLNELLINTQEYLQDVATRKASQQVLDVIVDKLPELIGGSADLSHSNLTFCKKSLSITPENFKGNYIHYGVREFGMAAIMNGLALHGEFIPYGGTFLVFADYARNAIRMSALMKQRVIYVLTHDSIGLGEDGPTHQPIEHLCMLRITPNVSVWRPCDATETVVAWKLAIERKDGPTCLALSRQKLPAYKRSHDMLKNIARGGYIIQDCSSYPKAIIIATGSEVEVALAAADHLARDGMQIRVVSMPCPDLFLQQDAAYRAEVLPDTVQARVAVEAGAPAYWHQFVGTNGKVLGIEKYGESAPCADLYDFFGITKEQVIHMVRQTISVNGD